MYIDKYFEDTLFPTLKASLQNTVDTGLPSKIDVFKKYVENHDSFPVVVMTLSDYKSKYNTLSYGEVTENFSIDINVYAEDYGNLSKKTVCDKITRLIVEWFNNNLKVTVEVKKDVENIDSEIQRNYICVTGVLDTKYGDPTIYPSLNEYNNYWR